MQYIFIMNPNAGKKDCSIQLETEIKKVFKGEKLIITRTEYAKHATELARTYAQDYKELTLFACGGDGTVKEVVEGIYNFSHVRLGIIPIGTGNDFIRYFKEYQHDDFLNLENMKNGSEFQSDLLVCENHVCLNIASIGLDAMVVERVDKFKRIPFISGALAYYLALFLSFLSSIHFKQSLLIDDHKTIPLKSYLFVVVANGSYYGGGFHPTPMSSIQDGIIDVLTIDSLSRRRILGLMKIYQRGEHMEYDFVNHYPCKKIQILGDSEVILNMDGETIKIKDPTIEILPKAITLVLPKK